MLCCRPQGWRHNPNQGPRALSLTAHYNALASCSGLTNLIIEIPDRRLRSTEVASLAQLTSLRQLNFKLTTNHVADRLPLHPLSQLTNLESLVVTGLCPKVEEVGPGHQVEVCFPQSLTALTLDFAELEEPLYRDNAKGFVNAWLQNAVGVGNLKQLQLNCLRVQEEEGPRFEFLRSFPLGSLLELTSLRVMFAPDPEKGVNINLALPPDMTKLSKLQVLWVGTYNGEGKLRPQCACQQHF